MTASILICKIINKCTVKLVRIAFCGLPKNSMESDFFFALLSQCVIPPETTAVVGLEPSCYPANNQGSKSCVYCYQSFAPVNSWVCTIIFTKITLLLRVYLTYLKKTFYLVHGITDTLCLAQGLLKSENNLHKIHLCWNFVWWKMTK